MDKGKFGDKRATDPHGFAYRKKRSDRKQKIPWAVISLSPFVQDIRSFLKRSKVYFGILLSSKYLEHSRSSL